MGLIAVAVALPVDQLLGRAFEIANEGDMPGNWLDAPSGVWKLVLGKGAHNKWRLADQWRHVSELVRWMVGGGAESDFQVVRWLVGYALRSAWAALLRALRGRREQAGGTVATDFGADEDAAASAVDAARGDPDGDARDSSLGRAAGGAAVQQKPHRQASSRRPSRHFSHHSLGGASHVGSAAASAVSRGGGSENAAEARAEALAKRLYASAGLLGVYVCWVRPAMLRVPRVRRCRFAHD